MLSLSSRTARRSITRNISLMSTVEGLARNSSMVVICPPISTRTKPCWRYLFRQSSAVSSAFSLHMCIGARTAKRVPGVYDITHRITSSTPCFFTSSPLTGLYVCPTRAKSMRKYSYISVLVPTVERGLRLLTFCSMAMAGGMPLI